MFYEKLTLGLLISNLAPSLAAPSMDSQIIIKVLSEESVSSALESATILEIKQSITPQEHYFIISYKTISNGKIQLCSLTASAKVSCAPGTRGHPGPCGVVTFFDPKTIECNS